MKRKLPTWRPGYAILPSGAAVHKSYLTYVDPVLFTELFGTDKLNRFEQELLTSGYARVAELTTELIERLKRKGVSHEG